MKTKILLNAMFMGSIFCSVATHAQPTANDGTEKPLFNAKEIDIKELDAFRQRPNIHRSPDKGTHFLSFKYYVLAGVKFPDGSCRYSRRGRISRNTRKQAPLYAYEEVAEDYSTCEEVFKVGPADLPVKSQGNKDSGITVKGGAIRSEASAP